MHRRLLFALWLYATLDSVDSVDSGREIARLSREHDAYRWICGGVRVNYHALDDFRANNEALLDELLTHNVTALAAIGVVSLGRVAHDGVRVQAHARAAQGVALPHALAHNLMRMMRLAPQLLVGLPAGMTPA